MIPRPEYPRPQFRRETFMNLNGSWDFAFDDEDQGIEEAWFHGHQYPLEILVPYVYQSQQSGIDTRTFHHILWYHKAFDIKALGEHRKWLLHFGAVDYTCQLWVNGQYVGDHSGGHIAFQYDVTRYLRTGQNDITLRVADDPYDLEIPRGKQYWREQSEGIFYTGSSGIWQTVWLEEVPESYIKQVWMTPDIDRKMIHVAYEIETTEPALDMVVTIQLDDLILVSDRVSVLKGRGARAFFLDQKVGVAWQFYEQWTWSPERPVLFDIHFELLGTRGGSDHVDAYFGMRKVSVVNGVFMLNNRPYYQKMLLDQGYWESSLLTAPSDEDFVTDIRLCKEMGFNGVRKHQKIEDPRYLYHADKMGFLVWGEIASAYVYSRSYVRRITDEWLDMIERDYNHPSIVAWTPLNESWGVDGIKHNPNEQSHAKAMYHLTKSLDQTRPVISNDGWDHTESDLCTIHDYTAQKSVLKERYKDLESILSSHPSERGLFAEGHSYSGQPFILSEFGGISYQKSQWQGWGYSAAESEEDFIRRYNQVISAVLESPLIQGFVYTQITDVEQEINGLLTYGRQAKVDPAIIRAINEGTYTGESEDQ